MSAVEYLTEGDALYLVRTHDFVIRDPGLLASAIARPQTSIYGAEAYPNLWMKAAALLESLALNHALVDGNKRIALVLTDVFLGLNGWDLLDTPEHVDYVLAVCTGQMGLGDSADHLLGHSVRADGAEADVIERAGPD